MVYRQKLIIVLGIVLLIGVAYGYVLDLLLFYDDLPVMSWLARHTWSDIWLQPEVGYYRPLTYVIYKFGMALPGESGRVFLHAANLVWLFLGAVLVCEVCWLCTEDVRQAGVAAVLYVVFPFMSKTIPWITAMVHPFVTVLVLGAVACALRAEKAARPRWWIPSVLLTALAPFAHENGAMAGAIVGGFVLLQFWGRKGLKRRLAFVGIGVCFTVAAVALRSRLLPFSGMQPLTFAELYPKGMFFLHGLLYPVGPLMEWLVRIRGWHDFALLIISAFLIFLLMGILARKNGLAVWFAQLLWWWGCAALPAALFFDFAALYVAPRLYTYTAASAVLLWATLIVKIADGLSWRRLRWLALYLLTGSIVFQNVSYIAKQRTLFLMLNPLYEKVLDVVADADHYPLAFVNLPYQLTWQTKTYPLAQEGVVFVPWYANLAAFVVVNGGQVLGDMDVVVYGTVLKETDPALLPEGEWLDVMEIYPFARTQRTVWVTSLEETTMTLALREAGAVTATHTVPAHIPLVQYEGGTEIVTTNVEWLASDLCAVTLLWHSAGPVGAEIFVHVRDGSGALVTQADGPALDGLAPIWAWRAGDEIRDVRYIRLPAGSTPPYTVQVGIYTGEGRFPAFGEMGRFPDDAATVIVIPAYGEVGAR
ncbi:MAG: hypothetical protein JXR84_07515 [Anaerolineae bacterium]|nr:hypothetical protein [Anaerolineae bacterium]